MCPETWGTSSPFLCRGIIATCEFWSSPIIQCRRLAEEGKPRDGEISPLFLILILILILILSPIDTYRTRRILRVLQPSGLLI